MCVHGGKTGLEVHGTSTISIHIIDLWVRQISISGVYGPIATKFGMKVNLWTLMSGKILGFSYHGIRCHGDQNTFSQSNNGHFGNEVAYMHYHH